MTLRLTGALLTAMVGLVLASPARSQQRTLKVAVMPALYFSADEQSAVNLTQGLVEQYERQGYEVISMDDARSKFQGMGLSRTTHYPDMTALRFGRELGADLVAYPRLLAVGIPVNDEPDENSLFQPSAVVHLRVLNVHSRQPIYFRQVGHNFNVTGEFSVADFSLPQPVATAAAGDVMQNYFDRVAGSRQEIRTTR